jgi:hypothetical protein
MVSFYERTWHASFILKKIFDRIFWFHSIGFKIAAASKNILEAAAQNNKNR